MQLSSLSMRRSCPDAELPGLISGKRFVYSYSQEQFGLLQRGQKKPVNYSLQWIRVYLLFVPARGALSEDRTVLVRDQPLKGG
jgi:hypothetical protein